MIDWGTERSLSSPPEGRLDDKKSDTPSAVNERGCWIPVAHPSFEGNEARYVLDCVQSEWVSSNGGYVSRFETEFATFCGVKEAISCTNGTAALHLAMAALSLGPGDEVIVPALTYIATANAVKYCGATPVFADSDAQTMNLDPADVDRKITSRTKAVVPVHLYGQCADMDPILELTEGRGITVVEDAAEAHGATYRGRRAGSMGVMGTFSFFGNKIITTGEGGMVTLNDAELARRVRLLRDQGADAGRRYWHTTVGFNYRMTNLQAALGVAQLERVTELLQARAQVAAWYDEELADLDDVVQRPQPRAGNGHVYWMYTVVLAERGVPGAEEVMDRLQVDGIETRPVFRPVHLMPPYFDRTQPGCPVAEHLSAQGISLPTHPRLTRDQVHYIALRLRLHLRS